MQDAPQKSASAPLVPAKPDPPKPSPEPPPQLPAKAPPQSQAASTVQGIKTKLLSKLGAGMRAPLDSFVDEKAVEILEQATVRAEEFRADTLVEVRKQALEMIDVVEKRLDDKLLDIEKMLEERMRAELKMKLRALVWTLVFVLLMAAVSIGYVYFKRQAGLESVNQAAPSSNARP